MDLEKKLHILVAEDESSIRDVLVELLLDEGHTCVPAVDGVDAATKLMDENFDLIISDFRMPRMNGADLLQWCRTEKIHLPVIFITANTTLIPEEKLALNDCCVALLKKPIDFNNLVMTIEDARMRVHTHKNASHQ